MIIYSIWELNDFEKTIFNFFSRAEIASYSLQRKHCYFIFQIMKLLYLFDTDSNWAVKKSSTYQKCFLSILSFLLNFYKRVLVLNLSFSESLTINFFQFLSYNYFAEHHADFYFGGL